MFNNSLGNCFKMLSKEFKVNYLDKDNNIIESNTFNLYKIILILETIPNDKYILNLKQIS